MTRASDMFMVVSGAALSDPRLNELDQETQRRRREGASNVVRSVNEVSTLTTGLRHDRATDIVWLGRALVRELL